MQERALGLVRERRFLGAVALFGLLLVVYSFSVGLRATRGASITADEPFYLLTTQSLIDDGDLDLTQQYERHSYREFFDHPDGLWRQSIPNEDGVLLSPHEPALSIFLVPGFAIGGLAGTQVQMMLLTAATFALAFVLVASETRALLLSWLATAAIALSASAFVYSTEIYPEVPAAMLLVLGLLVVRRPRLSVPHAATLALLMTLLAWFGMKYVPLGGLVGLYFLWRADWRGRGVFVALSALSAIAYTWLHMEIYGSLTAYNINTVFEGAPTTEVLQAHLEFEGRGYRIWGLFIDQRFGIGRWAPVLLLILPALPLLLRRGSLGVLALGLVVAQILIATFVAITMMGWWFPGRTLMTVFPLFALVLTELLIRVPRPARIGIAALAVYGIVIVIALERATRGGDVTLAVDPFDMPPDVFQATARLFPNYQSWSTETVVRTVAWVSAGLTLMAILVWREVNSMTRFAGNDRTPAGRLFRRFRSQQAVAPSSREPAPQHRSN
jgi:hypothetical protein